MKIGLVRHGMTDWNVERRAQGQTNIPLNKEGIKQADALATRLVGEDWDLIVTSNLSRAYETANTIAKKIQVPLLVDERLQERSFGLLEGTTEAERVEKWGPSWNMIDFGVEDDEKVRERSYTAVMEACEKNPDLNILFVSHGATIVRLISRLLNDKTFNTGFANTSFSIFEKLDDKWECKLLNCAKHLEYEDGKIK